MPSARESTAVSANPGRFRNSRTANRKSVQSEAISCLLTGQPGTLHSLCPAAWSAPCSRACSTRFSARPPCAGTGLLQSPASSAMYTYLDESRSPEVRSRRTDSALFVAAAHSCVSSGLANLREPHGLNAGPERPSASLRSAKTPGADANGLGVEWREALKCGRC